MGNPKDSIGKYEREIGTMIGLRALVAIAEAVIVNGQKAEQKYRDQTESAAEAGS